MALPAGMDIFDEDGARMCLEIGEGSVWGEPPAGRDWQITLNDKIVKDGWVPSENVPCHYTKDTEHGLAEMVTIVDDMFISEPRGRGHPLTKQLRKALGDAFGAPPTMDLEPTSFAGYSIARDRSRKATTLRMTPKIEQFTRLHLPEISEPSRRAELALPKGVKLQQMLESLQMPPADKRGALSKGQRRTRAITGGLKWFNKVMPRLTQSVHCLSCVLAHPPPEALKAAEALLAWVHDNRELGITFGGNGLAGIPTIAANLRTTLQLTDGAPADPLMATDATWGDKPCYSVLLTDNGGAVLATKRLLHNIVASSFEAEAKGAAKGGEAIEFYLELLRAQRRFPPDGIALLMDNKSAAEVAAGIGNTQRARHCLRSFHILMQRVQRRSVRIGYVPDPQNPADYLTKFLDREKVRWSDAYATNIRNAVPRQT